MIENSCEIAGIQAISLDRRELPAMYQSRLPGIAAYGG
jgi:hypothetical protein